jgi:hypothetical protein
MPHSSLTADFQAALVPLDGRRQHAPGKLSHMLKGRHANVVFAIFQTIPPHAVGRKRKSEHFSAD